MGSLFHFYFRYMDVWLNSVTRFLHCHSTFDTLVLLCQYSLLQYILSICSWINRYAKSILIKHESCGPLWTNLKENEIPFLKFKFLRILGGFFVCLSYTNSKIMCLFCFPQPSKIRAAWNFYLSKRSTNLKCNVDSFSKFTFLHFLRQFSYFVIISCFLMKISAISTHRSLKFLQPFFWFLDFQKAFD